MPRMCILSVSEQEVFDKPPILMPDGAPSGAIAALSGVTAS